MKTLKYIFLLFVFVNCNTENALDCLQTSGDIIEAQVSVASFSEILVWDRVQLFISYGEQQNVRIQTGENLLPEIELQVIDGQLNIRNNNTCNLIRDYGVTKVYVTSPNISEIRSSTGLPIKSIGVLPYPSLTLKSESQEGDSITHTDGDFDLDLAVADLFIVTNGFSRYYLRGTATRANIQFFGGNGALTAPNLQIQELSLFHRSSSDLIVNPQQSIQGDIVSVGNVISKNKPPVVAVHAPYVGQLIFE